MNVTFACPRCEHADTMELSIGATGLSCPRCLEELPAAEGTWEDGELARCAVCGSRDLFVRKDFPQRLGLAIVVAGFAISCVTWYFYWTYTTFGVLFATALADMLLFLTVGESLVCYRCRAEYRRLDSMAEHGPFNLETHERYRQQAARLAERTRQAPGKAPATAEHAAAATGQHASAAAGDEAARG